MQFERILVRATNWVGDAVMSLPALQALRDTFPRARIAIVARPLVAALYRLEPFGDDIDRIQLDRSFGCHGGTSGLSRTSNGQTKGGPSGGSPQITQDQTHRYPPLS